MRRTFTHLSDGRELIYYDESEQAPPRDAPDLRGLPPFNFSSEVRFDPLAGEWVIIASHRQERTFLPAPDHCPLCPSREGRLTEIPAPDYEVVVFENRFPSLATSANGDSCQVTPFTERRPGLGRCEVVCFSSDHDSSLARLGEGRVRTVVEVWAERTAELGRLSYVEQIMPFENRGEEIGVTLNHPHGQIYAYPFVTPRAARRLENAREHHRRHGGCLFCAVVGAEAKAGVRAVARDSGWFAFVSAAARWPYEVQIFPLRHVPDLDALDGNERDALARVLVDVLRRLDGLFDTPTPYILACQQAPVRDSRELGHLHFELTSPRRSRDRLKYLAGSETAGGVFINDVSPEVAAAQLREAGAAGSG
ncbi:MAG: galactose-1-phosphate uridylyltransferase [Candidatus Dormibacteraeota bacterium]|nr:galactose-1-phosphate uridylyltransferase [Candidatus Dormibacteraeota bacterium]